MENKHHHDDYHPFNESAEETMERLRNLYANLETPLDQLTRLSQNPEDHEVYEEFLNDLAAEALQTNDEFLSNAEAMKSNKLSKERQIQVRDRQRELLSEMRIALVQEAGLDAQLGLTDIDAAKQAIRERIASHIEINDATEPIDVLSALGILRPDDEGNERFIYPEQLFPESTNSKWYTYVRTVLEHLRLAEAVKNKTAAPVEVGEADKNRRVAHNAVARDVHALLGLDALGDHTWDFEKTRDLLTKMRDARFPTVETSEKAVTQRAVLEGAMGAEALKALLAQRPNTSL